MLMNESILHQMLVKRLGKTQMFELLIIVEPAIKFIPALTSKLAVLIKPSLNFDI